MGLLSFFFGIPVLDKVEALLWDKAYQRYLEEGGSPVKDLNELNKDIRGRLKGWVAEWRAEEDKKLRPIWREFKTRLQITTEDAFSRVFEGSQQSWYSVEAGQLPSFPEAIAVPVAVVRLRTEEVLPEVLAEKIEFKDLRSETRRALARYAVDRSFERVLNAARRDYRPLKISGRLDLFVIADVIERDFYHLGSRDDASRVDMIVLVPFDRASDERARAKHVHEKKAVARWVNDLRAQRSDRRRFSGLAWGLDQATLEGFALGGTS